MPNSIILDIADFHIRLNFYLNTESTQIEKKGGLSKFHEAIMLLLKNFISETIPSRIDYYINFHYSQPRLVQRHYNGEEIYFLHFYTKKRNYINTYQHLSISQFLYLLIKILQLLLARHDGFILHASAVQYKDKLLVFTGNSGSGKSTAMKLLKVKHPPFADDTLIIRMIGRSYYAFQSPMLEKYNGIKKSSQKIKIENIFFLSKADKETEIRRMKKNSKLINLFLRQVFLDERYKKKLLNHAVNFLGNYNNFFSLSFRKNRVELLTELHKNHYLSSQQVSQHFRG